MAPSGSKSAWQLCCARKVLAGPPGMAPCSKVRSLLAPQWEKWVNTKNTLVPLVPQSHTFKKSKKWVNTKNTLVPLVHLPKIRGRLRLGRFWCQAWQGGVQEVLGTGQEPTPGKHFNRSRLSRAPYKNTSSYVTVSKWGLRFAFWFSLKHYTKHGSLQDLHFATS